MTCVVVIAEIAIVEDRMFRRIFAGSLSLCSSCNAVNATLGASDFLVDTNNQFRSGGLDIQPLRRWRTGACMASVGVSPACVPPIANFVIHIRTRLGNATACILIRFYSVIVVIGGKVFELFDKIKIL